MLATCTFFNFSSSNNFFIIEILSSKERKHFSFEGFFETRTVKLSNIEAALFIISRCPFVIGSNEPGNIPFAVNVGRKVFNGWKLFL